MKKNVVVVNLDAITSNGGRLFVCSDIHGNIEAFMNLLNKIRFSTNDFMVVNGDVIDRGLNGVDILLFLMKNKENFLFIKGNHEEMMLDALNALIDGKSIKEALGLWFYNGGEPTYNALGKLDTDVVCDIMNFVMDAPYVSVVKKDNKPCSYIAHAGINKTWLECLRNGNIPQTYEHGGIPTNAITWSRDQWWNSKNDLDHLVITGHTHSTHFGGELGKPLYDAGKQRLILDTSTVKTSKIGYAVFQADTLSFGV